MRMARWKEWLLAGWKEPTRKEVACRVGAATLQAHEFHIHSFPTRTQNCTALNTTMHGTQNCTALNTTMQRQAPGQDPY